MKQKSLLCLLMWLNVIVWGLYQPAQELVAQPVPFTLEVTDANNDPSTYPYKIKFSEGSVTDNGDGTVSVSTGVGGGGDVVGPATATDNAVVVYDGTTGELLKDSGILVDGSDNLTLPASASLHFVDATTKIYQSGSDMYLLDPTAGLKTLSELAAGGGIDASELPNELGNYFLTWDSFGDTINATLVYGGYNAGFFITDTTNFDGNLSSADDTIQKALDTLDDLVVGGGESTTVSDTSEIDLTLTGVDITADIVNGSIDETKLDVSTNASLDLADSALQAEVDGSTTNEINTVQGDDDVATTGLAISIDGAGIVTTDVVGDVLTITGTEVDGSTTNEINTIQGDDDVATTGLAISIDGAGTVTTDVVGDVLTITGSAHTTVEDTAYGATWDGDTDATSKNTIYDKIESLNATVGLPTWIGSWDGSAVDAITDQENWAGTTVAGGWNDTASNTTHTITHNTGWSRDDYVIDIELRIAGTDVIQKYYNTDTEKDGTNFIGLYISDKTSTDIDLVFRQYRVGTTAWSSDYEYRVILTKIRNNAWELDDGERAIGVSFDGGGSEIADDTIRYLYVPHDITIDTATIVAETDGAISIDVWKTTYASHPPVVGDLIDNFAIGASADSMQETGLSISLSAGDVLAFNIDSCTTITNATIVLSGTTEIATVGTAKVVSALPGTIKGGVFQYTSTTSVTPTVGYAECNGSYYTIPATAHTLTSLASGEDFHYIYIDDSASTDGGDAVIIDSTTEPALSATLQGWYNGNDRCIFFVHSPDSSSTISKFYSSTRGQNLNVKFGVHTLLQNNATADATWKAPSTSLASVTPVNTVEAKLFLFCTDTGSSANIYMTTTEMETAGNGIDNDESVIWSGEQERSACIVDMPLGQSRNVLIGAASGDDNALDLRFLGVVEIQR